MYVRWVSISASLLAVVVSIAEARDEGGKAEIQRLARQQGDIAAIEKMGGIINACWDSCLVLPDRRPVFSVEWCREDVRDVDLAHLESLEKVENVVLWCEKVTDAGLARLQGLKRLKRLELAKMTLTDAGLEPLLTMNGLEVLRIPDARITDAGLARLASLAKRGLQVWRTSLLPVQFSELRKDGATSQGELLSGRLSTVD